MNHKVSFKIIGPSHIKTLPNNEGFEIYADKPIEITIYNGRIGGYTLDTEPHSVIQIITEERK